MTNHDRARIVGTLLATTLASTAFAMEPTPSSTPPSSPVPAVSLPAFLDVARLPDMQEAWRARFSEAETASPAVVTATPVEPGGPDAAVLETSRAAISRAEQLSRDTASVRSRAEELSRRFTVDPNASSDPPAAAQPAPTETASIVEDTNASPPASGQVLAPTDGEFTQVEPAVEAPVKKQAAVADAPVIEDMAAVPPMGVTRTPTPPSVRQAAQAAARRASVTPVKAVAPVKAAASDASTKPDESPMMPTEIRSFGWNAQP
jgi:hypothetical protein